jgi:hypothetical protein
MLCKIVGHGHCIVEHFALFFLLQFQLQFHTCFQLQFQTRFMATCLGFPVVAGQVAESYFLYRHAMM